jgi:hypothetical protein
VTLAQVKQHRRLDSDDTSQDSTISILITAARRYAEAYTGQSLITQKWRATMDRFPGVMLPATPFAAVAAWLPTPQPSNEIQLLHGPIQTVDLITYLDTNAVSQTLAGSKWKLDASGIFPRIAPTYGNAWPDTLEQIGSVTVDFTAGYGLTADLVPVEIVHWMLVRIGTLFENREEVAILSRGKIEPLPWVDGLLDYNKAPVI